MTDLQINNIPDSLYQRLEEYARQRQCTVSQIVLKSLERELERIEFEERLMQLPPTAADVSAGG